MTRPPAPLVTGPPAGAAVLQRVAQEDVEEDLSAKELRVFRNLLIFQMFEEKKGTPEEVLADSTRGEWMETILVWSQTANAKALERYAFLLHKAAGEGKLLSLTLTLSQLSAVDAKLKENGKEAQGADFILLAAVKGLDSATLLGMIDTNVAVEARGYPYPFASMVEFTTFKQGVLGLAAPGISRPTTSGCRARLSARRIPGTWISPPSSTSRRSASSASA